MTIKLDPKLSKAATLGLQFCLTIAFCVWVGVKLDAWWRLAPWGVIGMSALGFAGGLYQLVRGAKRCENDGNDGKE